MEARNKIATAIVLSFFACQVSAGDPAEKDSTMKAVKVQAEDSKSAMEKERAEKFKKVEERAKAEGYVSSLETENPNEFVEMKPENFKRAFQKDTIIKLNGIVSDQLTVVNEYDAMIGKLKEAIKTNEKTPSKELKTFITEKSEMVSKLSERSKANLAEIIGTEETLIKTKEEYNKATFTGMMTFVEAVDKEISREKANIDKSLANSVKMADTKVK